MPRLALAAAALALALPGVREAVATEPLRLRLETRLGDAPAGEPDARTRALVRFGVSDIERRIDRRRDEVQRVRGENASLAREIEAFADVVGYLRAVNDSQDRTLTLLASGRGADGAPAEVDDRAPARPQAGAATAASRSSGPMIAATPPVAADRATTPGAAPPAVRQGTGQDTTGAVRRNIGWESPVSGLTLAGAALGALLLLLAGVAIRRHRRAVPAASVATSRHAAPERLAPRTVAAPATREDVSALDALTDAADRGADGPGVQPAAGPVEPPSTRRRRAGDRRDGGSASAAGRGSDDAPSGTGDDVPGAVPVEAPIRAARMARGAGAAAPGAAAPGPRAPAVAKPGPGSGGTGDPWPAALFGRDAAGPGTLEEVDVLIAFEQYDKASVLLGQMLADEPQDPELLLRRYHVRTLVGDDGAPADDALAGAMSRAPLSAGLERVREVGRGLLPGDTLFDDDGQREAAKRMLADAGRDVQAPQAGDEPAPQDGDVHAPQAGDEPAPQCGDIQAPSGGDEREAFTRTVQLRIVPSTPADGSRTG